ncbi:MAG: glucose-1-phosphate cytidylyltransferase [Clostridia bacterium]|nr:glucose-1-phosphate cytidylyltransferase [Clostridia bacterium]
MKVVILAGGLGTRISEESHLKPKPMIEIGENPILWHIMKIYSKYGFNEFVICLGYKGYKIKEYFRDYYMNSSDITFDFENNQMITHDNKGEKWKVTLVDTGLKTLTAGRLKRIREYLGDEPFLLTYGDGVGDVNINELINWHKDKNRIGTITSYNWGQRFGVIAVNDEGIVTDFREKKKTDGTVINAGFMVFEPSIFNYLPEDSDNVMLEEILDRLSKDGELVAYKHEGFWHGMDTQRDKIMLEEMWQTGNAKWKIWEN